MPPLVVPNAAQIRLIWNFGGTPFAVNVMHIVDDDEITVDQALADAFADAVEAAMTSSNLDDFLVNDVTVGQVGIRSLHTANQPEFLAATTAAGVSTGDPLPLMVSLVVTLRTALAGRSFRGRVYIPGWTEGANDTLGNPSAAAAAAADAFITAIDAYWGGLADPIDLAVLSRKLLEANPVTSIIVRDLVWDTQRRRVIPGI